MASSGVMLSTGATGRSRAARRLVKPDRVNVTIAATFTRLTVWRNEAQIASPTVDSGANCDASMTARQ